MLREFWLFLAFAEGEHHSGQAGIAFAASGLSCSFFYAETLEAPIDRRC
jgi:hypothetical protein